MALPAGAMRIRVSVSGTCFTQTTIFIGWASWSSLVSSALVPREEERPVRPPEAEGVAQRVADLHLAGLVGHAVEVALGVRGLVVDRRGEDLVAEGEGGDAGLEAARRPQQVPGHRLR